MGRAKPVIRHLGPSYTVDEVITVLTREYEGVASSDVIFKYFYQLRQESNEKSSGLLNLIEGYANPIINQVP